VITLVHCSLLGSVFEKYKLLLPVAGVRFVAVFLRIHGSWIQILAPSWLS